MNIEELNMILDALSSAGEGVMTAFIIYVGVGFLEYLIGAGAIIYAVWCSTSLLSKLVRSENKMKELRDYLGLGSDSYLTDRDVSLIVTTVKELYDESKRGER